MFTSPCCCALIKLTSLSHNFTQNGNYILEKVFTRSHLPVWILVLRTHLCMYIFSNKSELLGTPHKKYSTMRKDYFRKFLYFISRISQKSMSSKIMLERGFQVIFKEQIQSTGKRKLMVSYTKPKPTAALIIIPCFQFLDNMPKQLRWQGPGIIVLELQSCLWICHIVGLSLRCLSSSSSRRPFPLLSKFLFQNLSGFYPFMDNIPLKPYIHPATRKVCTEDLQAVSAGFAQGGRWI